jgi:hypothetical protein
MKKLMKQTNNNNNNITYRFISSVHILLIFCKSKYLHTNIIFYSRTLSTVQNRRKILYISGICKIYLRFANNTECILI